MLIWPCPYIILPADDTACPVYFNCLCYALFNTSNIGVIQSWRFEPESHSTQEEAELYKVTCKNKYQNDNVRNIYFFLQY